MDGLAVIRTAQSRRPGLPAVLVTGHAGDAAVLALGGAVSGSYSLLRKPVCAADLVDRIRSLLAERNGAGR
jgi:CheY-like chemotaxis protein